MDGIFLGHNLLLSQAFSVGIPSWMGFSGPQLVVVSGLFFVDGILAVTKPFSQTFSFFTMEFRLSRSLSHEHFLFSRWNFGYHEAFLTNFFFFHDGTSAITKPFSQTFSFFSRWNFGYHEAFLTNFFFCHDGNSAITKPFLRTFSFFTM
jgi:hypothetical protein